MVDGFVYRWTNKIDGKWYVGSHAGRLDDGYVGSGLVFKLAVAKYGLENFAREILYEGPDFRAEEERVLKELDAAGDLNSYNMKNEALGVALGGADNGMFGKKMPPGSRRKISATLSSGERWGASEKRRAQSVLMSGDKNPMFGKKRSGTEAARKISTTFTLKKAEWGFMPGPRAHRDAFYGIFRYLVMNGKLVKPRGELVLEVENFAYTLPPYVRFSNFAERKLKLPYVKREFLWYLRGDRFDTSIADHAQIWKTIINVDGSVNSNYGQYLFGPGGQFARAVDTLSRDKESRRASMAILSREHLLSDTNDVPCTYALNFRIRDGRLNVSVHMRSQDAVFGMGNDIPAFCFIQEMALHALRRAYPELTLGNFHCAVDSFHVYERHWMMLAKIVGRAPVAFPAARELFGAQRPDRYSTVLCPQISSAEEVDFLLAGDFGNVPEKYGFVKWLLT